MNIFRNYQQEKSKPAKSNVVNFQQMLSLLLLVSYTLPPKLKLYNAPSMKIFRSFQQRSNRGNLLIQILLYICNIDHCLTILMVRYIYHIFHLIFINGHHLTCLSLFLAGTSYGYPSHWYGHTSTLLWPSLLSLSLIMLPPLHIVIPIMSNLQIVISIIEHACTYQLAIPAH